MTADDVIERLGLIPHPREGGEWALLGATMAPGFSYEDYEEGDGAVVAAYPEVEDLARALLPPDAAA